MQCNDCCHCVRAIDVVHKKGFMLCFQFFYLITDSYKMGTLKEMQKWAYEIHSSFLVPGSPFPVSPDLEQSTVEEIDR